jgi:hypothetical protein
MPASRDAETLAMVTRNTRAGDGKPASRPGLRVVGGAQEGGSPATTPAEQTQTIFEDRRSGRDRREEAAKSARAAGQARDPTPRASSERRRGQVKQDAWWLERDYVESHHFVQKSSAGRGRKSDDDSTPEE